jgi:hypothetical protein
MTYLNNPLPIPANVNIGVITVRNGTTPREETSCTCSGMIWLFFLNPLLIGPRRARLRVEYGL